MKVFPLLSLSLIPLAACDAPSAPPAAMLTAPRLAASAILVNERVPVSGTYIYTCGPVEPVINEGFVHVVRTGEVTETTNESKLHVNYQGVQGIGVLSGDRYIFALNENSEGYLSSDPFERSSEVDFINRVIREGSDDNAWVRITFKFSFPPLVFEIIRMEVECRG
jgi:hypothetical protein